MAVSNHDNSSIGRRLSTWRRAMLAWGPDSAKKVALALAEFAWSEGSDPDGDLIARHCKQKWLRQLCGYGSAQGLYKQLDLLEATGWIEEREKGLPTGPGVFREYVLTFPCSLPRDGLAALANPGPGMWKRVLEANTERTGEPELTRSAKATESAEQVNSSYKRAETGQLRLANRSTPVTEQVNSSGPLEGDLSTSLGDLKKEGSPPGGSPEQPTGRKQAKSDWQSDRDSARRALGLKTGNAA